jgi:hypothetical protein
MVWVESERALGVPTSTTPGSSIGEERAMT